MLEPEIVAAQVLTLSEAELASEARGPYDAREMDLLDLDFHGVAIAGPEAASVGGALPIAVAMRQTAHRAWQVTRDMNATLVALDLDRREVLTAPVWPDDKLDEHPPDDLARPTEPTGPAADGIVCGVERVDAAAALGLPAQDARYRLYIVCHDWVSNPVNVVVGDEAAARGAAPESIEIAPPPAEDPDARPRYRPIEDPDEEPDDPFGDDEGDATRAEVRLPALEITLRAGDDGLIAEGSATVLGDPRLFAPPGTETHEGPVIAVTPVTVMAIALDSTAPAIAPLRVPVYGVTPAAPAMTLGAFFSLDLGAALEPGLPPRATLFVALEGELIGPIAVSGA